MLTNPQSDTPTGINDPDPLSSIRIKSEFGTFLPHECFGNE